MVEEDQLEEVTFADKKQAGISQWSHNSYGFKPNIWIKHGNVLNQMTSRENGPWRVNEGPEGQVALVLRLTRGWEMAQIWGKSWENTVEASTVNRESSTQWAASSCSGFCLWILTVQMTICAFQVWSKLLSVCPKVSPTKLSDRFFRQEAWDQGRSTSGMTGPCIPDRAAVSECG